MIVASILFPRPNHRLWQDYRPLLAYQRASCERFGCQQIVITDDVDYLSEYKTFYADVGPELMPALIFGQYRFLSEFDVDDDILLTGADCLLGRDPRSVFDGSFDLAVTTHPFSDCILNTGAIFVPAAARASVAALWFRAYRHCGARWGDDQLSLAKVIEPTLQYGVEMRSGQCVRFLSCREHNWAPESIGDDAGMPTVVHFRGSRKSWLAQWFERWVG